jgi:hypothetical protein
MSHLVQQVDYRWKHFEADLRLIYSKLERFGLAVINGVVIYAKNPFGSVK